MGDVHTDNDQCQKDISQCHDRYNDTADLGNALDTSENNHQGKYGQDDAHGDIVYLESLFECCTNGIALYGVERECKREDDEYGK